MQEQSTITQEFEVVETVVPSNTLEPVDVSAATEIKLRFWKPDRTVMHKLKSLGEVLFVTNGTDGLVRHRFTVEESTPGEWDVQAYVKWGNVSEFWSSIDSFYLKPNLPEE